MIPAYQGEDLAGRIAHLLRYADPAGAVAPRLARLLRNVEEGCIAGPAQLAFLADLERRTQNVECEHLVHGTCGLQADLGLYAPCAYLDRFAGCASYAPDESTPTAQPLRALGIEVNR